MPFASVCLPCLLRTSNIAEQARLPPTEDQLNKAADKAQAKADRAAAKEAAKVERKCQRDEKENEYAQTELKFLKELKSSVKAHARSATFACGGCVPFKTKGVADQQDAGNAIDAIQIRFGENGRGVVLSLPQDSASMGELNALVDECQPASFGRGNEEVHDEDYRKAGKLDRSAFATTFCPYEAGIIDVVSQLLVPQTKQDLHHCSIKAELYKLNVYSAPSGKFKAHVDTPRSETQIGSLVVSLPVDHEGGQLAVRNADKELVFDWSSSVNKADGKKAGASIKWAAFYSDCEHEVYEVTSGHRITLTYNLFVTRKCSVLKVFITLDDSINQGGLGHLAGSPSALEPKHLPLYDTLKTALASPGFLRHGKYPIPSQLTSIILTSTTPGRVLAIWLNHSYAHTNKHLNFLPSSLKGADMSLYETAHALGLWCKLGPIITTDWGYDDESSHRLASKFLGFNECNNGSGNLDPEGGEGFGYALPEGMVTWINPFPKKTQGRAGGDVEAGAKQSKEAQMAYMTYGNEPGIDIWYSRAVMLIRVPPFRLRGSEHPEQFWSGIRNDWAEDDEYDVYDDFEDYEDYHGYT
ncbi:hypothetical protein M409DRAFT_18490 [Zasmidium cellare ATCC 36951]|uniref:Fe2OG dioxygenase domain-containing protein n=1 Tax=Zasmidium cellare ATCC 36951 TaxID=1080233 RepID=A0A6A6CW53_ZASCE|nr:uncharacterized protein M409DRAFT_18490 [Zasmidium cellare ATCC 36951]KAF2171374.1 hypothetical protein M409DRAFT_18490 [Zasmidium cellare ATCC 36951]